MGCRSGWVIAGWLILAAGTARADALPYDEGSERGFDAKGVPVGLEALPDWVFVQFPAECTRDFDQEEEERLAAPAVFTVLENGKVFASPALDSPNADTCSFYAIDRRGFTKDVLVALNSMTHKERHLFFETDPRARAAGVPTQYQVVDRGAAEIGLKEELRPIMTKDGPKLLPARRIWSLRGGKTRTEAVELPAPEPGPPPATPPAPESAPAPAKPVDPPPIIAAEPTKAEPAKAEPPPVLTPPQPAVTTAAPARSWLIMVGSFLVFSVVSGFFMLRRRR